MNLSPAPNLQCFGNGTSQRTRRNWRFRRTRAAGLRRCCLVPDRSARSHFLHLDRLMLDYRLHGANDSNRFAPMTRDRDIALVAAAQALVRFGVVSTVADMAGCARCYCASSHFAPRRGCSANCRSV